MTGTLRPERSPCWTGPSRPAPPWLSPGPPHPVQPHPCILVWVPAPRAPTKGGTVLTWQGRGEPLQEGSRPAAPAWTLALQQLEPAGHGLTLPDDGAVTAHRAQARSNQGFKSSLVPRGTQGLMAAPDPLGGRRAPPCHCVQRVSTSERQPIFMPSPQRQRPLPPLGEDLAQTSDRPGSAVPGPGQAAVGVGSPVGQVGPSQTQRRGRTGRPKGGGGAPPPGRWPRQEGPAVGAVTLVGFSSPGACWAPPPGVSVSPSLADTPTPTTAPPDRTWGSHPAPPLTPSREPTAPRSVRQAGRRQAGRAARSGPQTQERGPPLPMGCPTTDPRPRVGGKPSTSGRSPSGPRVTQRTRQESMEHGSISSGFIEKQQHQGPGKCRAVAAAPPAAHRDPPPGSLRPRNSVPPGALPNATLTADSASDSSPPGPRPQI